MGTMFGELTNPLVSEVIVRANIDTETADIREPFIEVPAHIVNCGDSTLWYVISDKHLATRMKIYGYSADGKLLAIDNDWGGKMKKSQEIQEEKDDSSGNASSGQDWLNLEKRATKSLNHTFYAADKKHFVEFNTRPEFFDDGSIIYDVFLGDENGHKKALGELVYSGYKDKYKEKLVWLDNNNFLLRGRKIFTTDGKVTDLEPLWGEILYASSYRVNSDRSKLALIGKDEQCNRLVKIIDISKLKVIAEKKHPYIETWRTGELCNNLLWDEQDKLYYENDMESALADRAFHVYCLSSSGSKLFSTNSCLLSSSPDYGYIAMSKVGGTDEAETVIYDTQNEAFLKDVDIKGLLLWISPEKFVSIEEHNGKTFDTQVYIYTVRDGEMVDDYRTFTIPSQRVKSAVLEKDRVIFTLEYMQHGALMTYELTRRIN